MALHMKMEFAGDVQLNTALAVATKNVKDLRPAWKELTRTLERYQKKVFMNKGAGSSARYFNEDASAPLPAWRKLKDSTVAGKRKAGFGKFATHPLIRTGALMRAFTKKGSKGAVRVETRKSFAWGVDESVIRYGQYHQLGTKHLVVRKPLRTTENLRRIIPRIIAWHIRMTGQLDRGSFGRPT